MIDLLPQHDAEGLWPVETAMWISGMVRPQAAPVASSMRERARSGRGSGRPRRRQPPAEAQRLGAQGAAGGVVGLDVDAAERRLALGGREAVPAPCR